MVSEFNLENFKIGIGVLAYKRKNTLLKILKILNELLISDIYVFLDKSPNPKLRSSIIANIKKINNNKIKIIIHSENIGLKQNWTFAYDYLFQKYDKAIILEDDIIIQKDFFKFMIYHLENKKKNIFFLSAYSPFNFIEYNHKKVFLSKRCCTWSQGTWKDVWIKFRNEEYNSEVLIKNYSNKIKLLKVGIDIIAIALQDYQKKINSIGLNFIWFCLKNNGFCLFPLKSLVSYEGFDENGTNHIENDGKMIKKNISINRSILKKHNPLIYNAKIDRKNIKSFNSNIFINLIIFLFPYNLLKIMQKIRKLIKY